MKSPRLLKTINIHEAKTHLSKLLTRVAAGEEIVIAKAGKPVARLVAISAPARKRVLGGWEDRVTIPDDFDSPLPEDVLADFER